MRKLSVLSSVLVVALTASLAHAGSFTFGLKAGAAIPTGDMGDALDPAFAGGVYADYWMNPQFALGADIAGDFFSGTTTIDVPPPTDFDWSFTILQFGAHATYAFGMEGSAIHPWIQGGLGLYNLKPDIKDVDAGDLEDSLNKFGFNAGLGADFGGSSSMKFGVGAEYHYISLSEDDGFSSSATYFRLMARLSFMTTGTTQ